jgi:hypothetical protein
MSMPGKRITINGRTGELIVKEIKKKTKKVDIKTKTNKTRRIGINRY